MTRRFPVRIGRAVVCELCLDDAGIWEQHLVLALSREKSLLLKAGPEAIVCVNGQPVTETLLRNGDTIDIGAVRIQFWLGSARQSRLLLDEALSWAAIVAAVLGQVAVLYLLLE